MLSKMTITAILSPSRACHYTKYFTNMFTFDPHKSCEVDITIPTLQTRKLSLRVAKQSLPSDLHGKRPSWGPTQHDTPKPVPLTAALLGGRP